MQRNIKLNGSIAGHTMIAADNWQAMSAQKKRENAQPKT